MAEPIKPKGRDYPLSTTPEPVNSLSLSRANEIERRPTQEKINSVYAKYRKEGEGRFTSRKTGRDTSAPKNWMDTKKMIATTKEIRSKDNDIVGKNLEKNLFQAGGFSKYKVPAKSIAKKKS